MATAWLSLGSNIEPRRYLRAAASALRERFDDVRMSPVYRSPAVGFAGPDFLNAAARIETDMEATALDAWLHALEDANARDRSGPRFSSRTLDVDLLLYDQLVQTGPGHLHVPRAELETQAFVLRPMVDLAPDLIHPQSGLSMTQMLARLDDDGGLERIDLVL